MTYIRKLEEYISSEFLARGQKKDLSRAEKWPRNGVQLGLETVQISWMPL